jgi:hypothetical protein
VQGGGRLGCGGPGGGPSAPATAMPSPARTSSVRSAALRTCTKPLGGTKAVMPVAVAARCRTRTSCRVSPAGRAMTAAMMVGGPPGRRP